MKFSFVSLKFKIETECLYPQIDEPGVNAGSKNRIELPPAYRQFSGDKVEQKVGGDESKSSQMRSSNTSSEKGDDKPMKKKNKKGKEQKTKTKKKPRNVRSLLNNYFMSRRRFYKMLETKMDR